MNTKSISIADKIQDVHQHLTPDVRLIAISKKVSVEKIREAYAAGIRDFGENRLQEALEKQEQLQDLDDICWHFIGHLQSNKAKPVLESMDWVHTVDSMKLFQRLNKLAGEVEKRPKICLQVKMLPDPNKYGWLPEELLAALPELSAAENLDIQGLMTMLPLGLSDSEILDAFQATRKFRDKISQTSNLPLPELSMGMSGDYLLAIQGGSTMIRVGRTIFAPDSTLI